MSTAAGRAPEAPMRELESGFHEIEPALLQVWLERGEALLVDVREPGEHAAERIAGSRLVPLSAFDPQAVPAAEGRRLVLYCRGGNRSALAGRQLLASGRPGVHQLRGGLTAWRAAGGSVEATAGTRRIPDLMRQVQVAAGSFILLGTVLGTFWSPYFLLLSGFVGAGLVFAGLSGTCGLALVLARMPWNTHGAAAASCSLERR